MSYLMASEGRGLGVAPLGESGSGSLTERHHWGLDRGWRRCFCNGTRPHNMASPRVSDQGKATVLWVTSTQESHTAVQQFCSREASS